MLEYCERVLSAETAEDVWGLHTQTMARFGFDRLLYGYTRFRTPTGFGDPDDFLVMTNHKPEYVNSFIREGHYFNAPMVQWAAANTGACSWNWVAQNMDSLSESELKVLAFNQKHGVRAGYSISFPDATIRNKGAIALTAREDLTQDDVDAIWAENGREIEVMNGLMHLKLIQLPYKGSERQLTKRQREVLEWVRDGKTTQDIAEIIGLTAATVEKHLRLAREALDVDTTAQAVLKASFRNQIFVFETESGEPQRR